MFMETISSQPPASGRVALFLRTVGAFERDEIEAAVDGLIALLDTSDGDPDVEPNGDELDASFLEWRPGGRMSFACAAGFEDAEDDDPAEDDDSDCCAAGEDDAARFSRGALIGFDRDTVSDCDAEDDGDAQDGNHAEDDFMLHDSDGGAGCPLSDPGGIYLGAYE